MEESKKQDNIEMITEKAILLLEENSKPQEMDSDWITNFFDKCRLISNEEMQIIWAKILAGEANNPGMYSKRTVNSLNSLSTKDAQCFKDLCRFVLYVGHDPVPFVYDIGGQIYNDLQVNFSSLAHLDDIGLVSFDIATKLELLEIPKTINLVYFDTSITLVRWPPKTGQVVKVESCP